MTFKEYLATQRPRYDAKGDFIRLAQADEAMPEVTTADELRTYVEQRGGYAAVEAGLTVWDQYQAELRADGRAVRRLRAAQDEDELDV
jgi:hypothetical protein